MSKRETSIELNGNRYDARSGALLATKGAGASLDGFVISSGSALGLKPVQAASNPTMASPLGKRPIMDINRPTGKPIAHHSPKKSQTLIRSAVKKPAPASLKRHAKTTTNTQALVGQPSVVLVKKLGHPNVDPRRARRAEVSNRSQHICRYAAQQFAPLATTPVAARTPVASIKPVHASMPAAHAVAAPAVASMDVFERALQRANSHLEPLAARPHRQKRSGLAKRLFSIASAALAVLLIAGFIAYQNQANLTMKYAGHKAGFAATLPAYSPNGFSAGKFTYSAGNVKVQYNNASSGQKFALIQNTSSWDSNALLDNYVSNQDSDYRTLQSAGRIIYTYGHNNATWVNGGVWYRINSAGNLTTSELVNLATSM